MPIPQIRQGCDVDTMFEFADSLFVLPDKPQSPVEWISEHFIDPIAGTTIKLEEYQARIIQEALSMRQDGSSVYERVIWSQPKKSGKTAIGGAVAAWGGFNIEAPNDICCVANDQEQSAGRIFAALLPTVESKGVNVPKGASSKPWLQLPNKTVIRAITNRYEGEAGANQGFSVWSELWAFQGERLKRLWEEMTPPPTRHFRLRWVETYAGFLDESETLWDQYTLVFDDETEETIKPDAHKLWDDLPVWVIEPAKALVFWDHAWRMPWQTEEYYKTQETDLRPSAIRRLHHNYWVKNEDAFITPEMWRAACRLDGPSDFVIPSVFAIDGNKNQNSAALVGCANLDDVATLTYTRIWEVEPGQEVDYGALEAEVIRLYNEGALNVLHYDAYQMVAVAQRLRQAGVPCEEFSQQTGRIKSDTFLYKLFKTGAIAVWDDLLLGNHVKGARAKELDGQRVRIIKPDKRNPGMKDDDGAVALSMAAYKAWTEPSGGWAW